MSFARTTPFENNYPPHKSCFKTNQTMITHALELMLK